MPGSIPATSQLDWLISTTAMIVLSWSRATRDLLKACPSEGRGRSAGASGHSISWLQRRWCHFLAACPIPSLSWREMDSNPRSLATSPSLSYAQIDVAARHYEGHALEHRHVVKRARIHSDHIGRFACSDRPNFVGKVEQLGGVDRRCFDRFAGM